MAYDPPVQLNEGLYEDDSCSVGQVVAWSGGAGDKSTARLTGRVFLPLRFRLVGVRVAGSAPPAVDLLFAACWPERYLHWEAVFAVGEDAMSLEDQVEIIAWDLPAAMAQSDGWGLFDVATGLRVDNRPFRRLALGLMTIAGGSTNSAQQNINWGRHVLGDNLGRLFRRNVDGNCYGIGITHFRGHSVAYFENPAIGQELYDVADAAVRVTEGSPCDHVGAGSGYELRIPGVARVYSASEIRITPQQRILGSSWSGSQRSWYVPMELGGRQIAAGDELWPASNFGGVFTVRGTGQSPGGRFRTVTGVGVSS